MSSEAVYIRAFQQLHRDSIPGRWTQLTLGRAPHKPLLLLCVSDLYDHDPERKNFVEPTLALEESFNMYWRKIFDEENSSTFALPFFHLQHDGFWHLQGVHGANTTDSLIAKSSSALRKAVVSAGVDPALHDLLRCSQWNKHLRSVLIASNFDADIHKQLIRLDM